MSQVTVICDHRYVTLPYRIQKGFESNTSNPREVTQGSSCHCHKDLLLGCSNGGGRRIILWYFSDTTLHFPHSKVALPREGNFGFSLQIIGAWGSSFNLVPDEKSYSPRSRVSYNGLRSVVLTQICPLRKGNHKATGFSRKCTGLGVRRPDSTICNASCIPWMSYCTMSLRPGKHNSRNELWFMFQGIS